MTWALPENKRNYITAKGTKRRTSWGSIHNNKKKQQQTQRITTHSAFPSSKRVKAKRRRDCDKPKTRPTKKKVFTKIRNHGREKKRKTISEKMRLLDILASLGLSRVLPRMADQAPDDSVLMNTLAILQNWCCVYTVCARRTQKLRVRFNDGVANAMMGRVRYFQYE